MTLFAYLMYPQKSVVWVFFVSHSVVIHISFKSCRFVVAFLPKKKILFMLFSDCTVHRIICEKQRVIVHFIIWPPSLKPPAYFRDYVACYFYFKAMIFLRVCRLCLLSFQFYFISASLSSLFPSMYISMCALTTRSLYP